MPRFTEMLRYGRWSVKVRTVFLAIALSTLGLHQQVIATPVPENLTFLHDWKIPNQFPKPNSHLQVLILELSQRARSKRYSLQVRKGAKEIFSSKPELSEPIYIASIDGSKLAVIWYGPGPSYRTDVYSYRNGVVTQVLRVGSKLYPEIVYPESGTGTVNQAGYILLNPRIISTTVVKQIDNGMLPIAACISIWNEKKHCYETCEEVPWSSRFKATPKK